MSAIYVLALIPLGVLFASVYAYGPASVHFLVPVVDLMSIYAPAGILVDLEVVLPVGGGVLYPSVCVGV